MLAAGWRQFRSELGEFSQVPGIGRMPQGATLLPVNLTQRCAAIDERRQHFHVAPARCGDQQG